jgi:hypothetical protein
VAPYDSRTKLESLRDHFETLGKGANYLLVGHSAGFVGCLSVLKDHPEGLPQQFRGIGQLIFLFGAGLLLASLLLVSATAIKINVTQAIIGQQKPSEAWLNWLLRRSIDRLALIGLWGSLIAFAAAIIFIMARFADAMPPN